jgi:hypothetical protein
LREDFAKKPGFIGRKRREKVARPPAGRMVG